MQKVIPFFLFLLLVTAIGFADTFVLENKTSYPGKNKKAKIAVQWASSAREVTEQNNAMLQRFALNPQSLHTLTQSGKINLTIPAQAEYFRVVVWSSSNENPDFVTNWVDVVPNKTYTLQKDHLVPVVLMAGTGC